MRPLVNKIKPTKGFSAVLHAGLVLLLPILLFILARLGDQFIAVSFGLVLLSKWRMFAVRPRFWAAIIRANSIDMLVGASTVVFLQHSAGSFWLQLFWAAAYAGWLLLLKPRAGLLMISIQAFVGQLVGFMALFLALPNAAMAWLVVLSGLICFVSARHFFDAFEEPYSKMLAYLWAYFGAALVWVMSHWLLFYGVVSQPTLILTTVGYGLAALYYFDHSGKLSTLLRRQFVFIMIAIILVIITFSDWGDKVV
ncbi:hypothetical protein KDA23_00930 [Candidatus Saccharibacteria bacterium]|nr:hypothetical protein [Candidatus Saccharibacteria bacterium]